MPAPLPLVAIHHVGRITRKLDESRAFYRDILGFREFARPNFDFAGAWLTRNGLQLHLIVNPEIAANDGSFDEILTRDNHLAFFVDDVAPAEELLRQHGIPFRVNIQTGTGLKQLFFRDPDGYHIELGTYPPTPPA